MKMTKEMIAMIDKHMEENEVGEVTICFNKLANKLDIIKQSRTRIKNNKGWTLETIGDKNEKKTISNR